MDMSIDTYVQRHCRAVLEVKRNQQAACTALGISWHTLKKYLSHVPAAPVPDLPERETGAQQLLRLQSEIPSMPVEVLAREIRAAEDRGAAAHAQRLIGYLHRTARDAAFEEPLLSD